MKTIAVLSRKGGAGKTTVAVNLALAARQAGLKVIVADVDPLHSAGEVLRGRPEANSLVLETTASKLFIVSEVCAKNRYDLMVIDTPPAPEGDVILAINVAQLCLAVARPTSLDVAAVQQSLTLIRRMGCPGLAVLNQCPPLRNGLESGVVERACEAMQFSGVPVAKAKLRSRVAYQHAFAHQQTVTEFDAASEAAGDVLRLLAEVSDHLMLPLLGDERGAARDGVGRNPASRGPAGFLQALLGAH